MNDSRDLINWAELSRLITGNETYISRTRCPKKYQPQVDSLVEYIEAWEKKIKEKD
jgi:hypothetical protein